MIDVTIPGYKRLQLRHLVLDFNGTLALDGALLPGVAERLRKLASRMEIHVVTADTFGCVRKAVGELPVTVSILPEPDQAEAKEAFVAGLGTDGCAAVGNGYNDHRMLAAAELGIAVTGAEGASRHTVEAADLVFVAIADALDALLNSGRLIAGLRR